MPAVPRLEPDLADDVYPGFPLLSESLQERLESLLSPQVPLHLAEPEPAPPAAFEDPSTDYEPEPAPVAADPWPPEAAGLAWPFGSWIDAAPEPVEAPTFEAGPDTAEAQPAGLLSRLAAWIRRRS